MERSTYRELLGQTTFPTDSCQQPVAMRQLVATGHPLPNAAGDIQSPLIRKEAQESVFCCSLFCCSAGGWRGWSPKCARPTSTSFTASRISLSDVRVARAREIGHAITRLFLPNKKPADLAISGLCLTRQRPTFPQPHGGSSMGPGGLNFRVRDGNGWNPSGMATGNS